MALLIDDLLRIALAVTTAWLFAIILLAYLRIRSTRLLFTAAGFAVIFLQALLYMPEMMYPSMTSVLTDNLHMALTVVGLLFVAIGLTREER